MQISLNSIFQDILPAINMKNVICLPRDIFRNFLGLKIGNTLILKIVVLTKRYLIHCLRPGFLGLPAFVRKR